MQSQKINQKLVLEEAEEDKGDTMLLKDLLTRRDKLKTYLHALKRSINYFEVVLLDDEMGKELRDLHDEVMKEFKDLENAMRPLEEMEM